MSNELLVALTTVVPTTVAIVVGFLANLRSVRRELREEVVAPMTQRMESLETSLDHLGNVLDRVSESQTEIREKIARLEAQFDAFEGRRRVWRPS
ncbi:MAG: hypothetical protein ABR529_11275 [Actinomycetota bacterium]